ncbi:hypothetical protein SCP_0800310 [Sparassis crispa]|uniref:Uncharacterized protein n=1 Tax=Sparassis crispa TaxID=139825 RepID=A0A401GUV4_9APHY|nr:hypothetical protein SCP_0800310 [Sparassis crispa]GBE85514.1 hypothetical protein SCP_0800310 [Sparassis crispa]
MEGRHAHDAGRQSCSALDQMENGEGTAGADNGEKGFDAERRCITSTTNRDTVNLGSEQGLLAWDGTYLHHDWLVLGGR